MSEERSFEDLQRELEEIVTRLERGDVPVDEAIALFRRGEELYRTCVERLQGAELRIESTLGKGTRFALVFPTARLRQATPLSAVA